MRSAAPGSKLRVIVDPSDDAIVIHASARCTVEGAESPVVEPGSFSWHVLSSLTDDVQTFHNGHDPGADQLIFGISLTTRRAGSAR